MKNATRIVVLIDRSGSMGVCRESTISGINKFVEEQKKQSGEVTIKLAQFDEFAGKLDYVVTFDKNLQDVTPLTQNDFLPRGGTPLLDAQARTIRELGEELLRTPEANRPERVIVVTITDGYENASTEFTANQVRNMIDHQKTKYNWDFVYLGANQDAVAVGQGYGYSLGKTMTFNSNNAATVGATFSNLSSYVTRSRGISGQSVQTNDFTEEERETSLEEK